MWLIFALGSALFAGITAILAKIGIKNTDSNVAMAIRTIIIVIFSWGMVFIVGSEHMLLEIDNKILFFLILSGIATGGSWLCYFKALQLGDVNKVTPIDKSSTLLTIILAFIFFHENITFYRFAGIVVMGIGTYLMISRKNIDAKMERSKKWMMYAILSAVFASLTSILGKIGIQGVESNLGTAIRSIVILIMSWVIIFVAGKQKEITIIDKKSITYICLSGITTGLSWLCYFKALQDGQVSIVVAIDKLSILLTISFSYFILKERITKKSLIGLTMILLGTFLLMK